MKKLNIGSGTDYREGWINLDYNSKYNPEVVWDLNKLPLPFGDNTFDEIIMIHVLEHFHDPLLIVNELWRIGKPAAKITIKVPHWSCHFSSGDLTHHHRFSSREFSHFEYDPIYYNTQTRFKVNTRLRCLNDRGRLPARLINFVFTPLLNLSFSLTENFLCKILPVYENIYELEVLK